MTPEEVADAMARAPKLDECADYEEWDRKTDAYIAEQMSELQRLSFINGALVGGGGVAVLAAIAAVLWG